MTRSEAKALYAGARTAADLRALISGDLFFLLCVGMNRPDVDCDWIYERCREVQASPDGHLDLWAREHYKSTIITIALTIQNILNNPEITIGIFSHTRSIAKAFLCQIKRELESNELLNDLFPDILWGLGAKKTPPGYWSENSLIVRRKTNPKESTVEAWGLVDGQPTGKHFSLLVYDDVVAPESVTTPDQIKKTTDAWALSLNLGAHGGTRRYIGTRYHFNDSYAEMMRREAAVPRLHPATADGTMEGEPVLLSREALAEKRREMGPYIFGCQMLQNPKADVSMGFKEEWFRTVASDAHEARGAEAAYRSANRFIVVDPASEKKKSSDYTVMWVLELGVDRNYYVVDGVRDRLNLKERADRLFNLHRTWRPLNVGYEKYGQQADIEHMRDRMDREHYHFNIVPLGGQMPKNDRIRRLIPIFEGGRMFFPYRLMYIDVEGRTHDLTREFLDEEFMAFPVAAHDDMLDGLARILDPELGAIFPQPVPDLPRRAVHKSSLYV